MTANIMLTGVTEHAPGALRISFVMPVFNPPVWALRSALDSLVVQTLVDWECILVDDASTDRSIADALDARASLDPRFRVLHHDVNRGIAAATNTGLDATRAPLISLVDHDDVLARDAAQVIVGYFDEHPHCDLVYSDECIIDAAGKVIADFKKPDYSPVRNLGHNYLNHLVGARTDAVGDIRLRSEYEPAQDFDFWLRVIEGATARGRDVGHIAAPLYGWRIVDGSTAASAAAKPAMFGSVQRCVRAAIERRGVDATANTVQLDGAPTTQVLVEYPLVDVEDITTVAVPSDTTADRLASQLDTVATEFAVVVPDDLVGASTDDWVVRLAAQAARPAVAAVGPVIVDRHHLILSVGRTIEPSLSDEFAGVPLDAGPFGVFGVTREVSAVAPWGMALDMSIYRDIGGLNTALPLDVAVAEYNLRAWDAGASVLVSPTARLVLDRGPLIGDPAAVDDGWSGVRRSRGTTPERFAANGVADLRRAPTAGTPGPDRGAADDGARPAPPRWADLPTRAESGTLRAAVIAVRDTLIISDTAASEDRFVAIASRLVETGLLDPSVSPIDAADAIESAFDDDARSWTQMLATVPGITAVEDAAAIAQTVTEQLDHLDPVVAAMIDRLGAAGCSIVLVARDPRPAANVADDLERLGVSTAARSNLVCIAPTATDDDLASVAADIVAAAGGAEHVVCVGAAGGSADTQASGFAQFLGVREPAAAPWVEFSDIAVVDPDGRIDLAMPAVEGLSKRTGCDAGIRRSVFTALGELGPAGDNPVGRTGALTLGPLVAEAARWVADCAAHDRPRTILVLGPRFADIIAGALAVAGIDDVDVVGVDLDPVEVALAALALAALAGSASGSEATGDAIVDGLARLTMVWPGDSSALLTEVFGIEPDPTQGRLPEVDEFIVDFARRPGSFAAAWTRLTERAELARTLADSQLLGADLRGSTAADDDRSPGEPAGQRPSADGGMIVVDLVTDGGLGALVDAARGDVVSLGLTSGPGRRGFSTPVPTGRLARTALSSWLGLAGGAGVTTYNLVRSHAVHVGLTCATTGVRQRLALDLGPSWRGELRAALLADTLALVGGGHDESAAVLALVSDDRFDARDPAWRVPLLAVGELERYANAVDVVGSVAVSNPSIEAAPIAVAVGAGRPLGAVLSAAARGIEVGPVVGYQPTGCARIALFETARTEPAVERVERPRVNADGWSLLTVTATMTSLGAVEFSAADRSAFVELGVVRVKRSRSAVTTVQEFADLRSPAVDYRKAIRFADHQFGQEASGTIRISIDPPGWESIDEYVEVAIAFRSIPATSIPAPPNSRSAATHLIRVGRARARRTVRRLGSRLAPASRAR